MAVSEPLPQAGEIQALLDDLSGRLSNLPLEQKISLEADLQKVKAFVEAALKKEREASFSILFERSSFAASLTRVKDSVLVDVNPAWETTFGYTRQEAVGRTSADLNIYLGPEMRERYVALMQAGQPVRGLELPFHLKSGETRIFLVNTDLVEMGGEDYLLNMAQDITDRRRAEAFGRALNEIDQIVHSSLDFRAVLNRSIAAAAQALGCDTAAISLRHEGRWNISGVYGFPEDILGMELDDNQERHAVLAIQTLQPVPVPDAFNDERFNREHLRKWGVRSVLVMPIIVRAEAIGVMFFNYQQSPCEFKQYHIDFVTQLAASLSSALVNAELYQNLQAEIEERKMIETWLRDSEERERERANELETIMDAAPAIIWISRDPDCREMTGNRYSYDFLSIHQGENVSKTAPDQDLTVQRYHMEIGGRPVEVAEMPMQIAAATGKPAKDYEFELVYEDGTRLHLFGNVNPLLDADGKPYGAIGVFVDLTSMRRLEAEQVAAQAEIEVQRRLMNQREQERQAIARDLHDGPIQTLSSSVFHLQMIKEIFSDPALQVELNQIGLDIKNTIHELRALLNDLRPPALMHFGFSRVLRLYTEDLRERYPNIKIDLDVVDDDKLLSDQARLALFRIYQAGINNIVRHSSATRAWVSYQIEQDTFRLELRDNGQGFAINGDFTQLVREGHFGLVGMKERAEAIGGQFSVFSEPGQGTRIVVTGPLTQA